MEKVFVEELELVIAIAEMMGADLCCLCGDLQ